MSYFIDERKLIDDNIFKFDERLNSPLTRFTNKTPTFTTYFHINADESTMDAGFKDVEDVVGNRSPLRFQRVENFPIYGIEQIVLGLQDDVEGLNTVYEGSGIILPGTIKPLQNDFFIIDYVKGTFIFRITDIAYDTIKIDNYYKISFKFEWLEDEKMVELERQVNEKFTCVLQNIGTENICIINEEYMTQINMVDEMYNDMVNTYKTIFYSQRYNCFMTESTKGAKLFDPFQSVFVNKHKLLTNKNSLDTIVLTEGYADNKRPLKYEKSIYRFFERRNASLVNNFLFSTVPGAKCLGSAFHRWQDSSIMIVDIPLQTKAAVCVELMPDDLVDIFKYNLPSDSVYIELMRKFVRNEKLTVHDIPLTLNEELLNLTANEEIFFYTPILLYIIKEIVEDFLKNKKRDAY